MLVVLYVAIAVVSLIGAINQFMKGRLTAQAQLLVSLCLVVIVVITLYVEGWLMAVLGVVLAIACRKLLRPVGARAAARVLARGKGNRYVGLPPRRLAVISRQLGNYTRGGDSLSLEQLMAGSDKRDAARKALVDYCAADARILGVLNEFSLSHSALDELYRELLEDRAGQWASGHWVAASTLAYPEALKFYLTARSRGADETSRVNPLLKYFEAGTPLASWPTTPGANALAQTAADARPSGPPVNARR